MKDIFISYRRADTDHAAHRIYTLLDKEFPGKVFIDADDIPVAANFPEHIRNVLRECSLTLVLIGVHWLNARNEAGHLRLHDPADWVRIEIETALAIKCMQVFPLLLSGARMPGRDELVTSLKQVAFRNASNIPTKGLEDAIQSLLPKIKELIEQAKTCRKARGRVAAISFVPGDRFQDGDDIPQMIVVPQGRFVMGSLSREKGHDARERPRRKLAILKPFAVSVYPITVSEWNAAANDEANDLVPIKMDGKILNREIKEARKNDLIRLYQEFETYLQKDLYPATGVSWDDARRYCSWLSRMTDKPYRLLSEIEWEYCCRAGKTTPFSTGSSINTAQAHFNRRYQYRHLRRTPNPGGWPDSAPRPVTSCFRNNFDVGGMHGNVWEWVEDCFHPSYAGAPEREERDQTLPWVDEPPSDRKVLRGGCFASGPNQLRSAYRGMAPKTPQPASAKKIGFRIACDI